MFSQGIFNILVLHEMSYHHMNFFILFNTFFVSSCAGFVKLKMQNKLGAPVAFVDFKVYVEKNTILPVPLSSILIYFL
jgi:hypothetical protein